MVRTQTALGTRSPRAQLNNGPVDDEYTTITEDGGEGFYSEKRSKFLAFAHNVTTEDQAKTLVAHYRSKYHDARHVCYAYALRQASSTATPADITPRPYSRANDDGEPSGTAGRPILQQINSHGLTDILIVVVRYYGGVNLGTGPLAVAYRTAAADAIANAQTVRRTMEREITFDFPYSMMNDVMRVVKDMNPRIVEQSFDNTCRLRMAIRNNLAAQLENRLAQVKNNHIGLDRPSPA